MVNKYYNENQQPQAKMEKSKEMGNAATAPKSNLKGDKKKK